jgi:hypothetical protein
VPHMDLGLIGQRGGDLRGDIRTGVECEKPKDSRKLGIEMSVRQVERSADRAFSVVEHTQARVGLR